MRPAKCFNVNPLSRLHTVDTLHFRLPNRAGLCFWGKHCEVHRASCSFVLVMNTATKNSIQQTECETPCAGTKILWYNIWLLQLPDTLTRSSTSGIDLDTLLSNLCVLSLQAQPFRPTQASSLSLVIACRCSLDCSLCFTKSPPELHNLLLHRLLLRHPLAENPLCGLQPV